ncbi:MAG: SpoIID/LytB domain-containing protein [Oscillospiraceae bacterium]|nr:SpoIID/LytB domain-containing protein [Oscillospiraceae bacterium]
MKKWLKATALSLAAAVLAAAPPATEAGAFEPPVAAVKIGLYYGSSALPSANLQNATGYGSGYDFGYFDESRNFVPIGAYTDAVKISVMRDRNMRFDGSGYVEGTSGDVVVGCFHIQGDRQYDTYGAAREAADRTNSSFVKYLSGSFYVCTGNYLTASAAEEARVAQGLGGSITSGTVYTVTVAETGTNRIIFEFDCGTGRWLGVMPRQSGGTKPQTWFRGYRYHGGFQYARRDGGDITVVNIVDIDDYTRGVIPNEMSNAWPLEALKAQALCARTYAMSKLGTHSAHGFDLCTTEHCQVYHGQNSANEITEAAVDQTLGQYITYEGELCETYFSSSDGGATEDVENVWNSKLPYLRGVTDPYEADIAGRLSNYSWTVTYTPEQITQRMRNRGNNCGQIVGMAVTRYTDMGNAYEVTMLDDGGRTWKLTKGDSIRSGLGAKSIRLTIGDAAPPGGPSGGGQSGGVYVDGSGQTLDSAMAPYYAIGGDGQVDAMPEEGALYAMTGDGEVAQVGAAPQTDAAPAAPAVSANVARGSGLVNGYFTIRGTGTGHNIGMSQWGAYSMAKNHNMTYDQIIHFYFTGVTIG